MTTVTTVTSAVTPATTTSTSALPVTPATTTSTSALPVTPATTTTTVTLPVTPATTTTTAATPATATVPPINEADNCKSDNLAAIIGVSIGGLVLVILIVGGAFYFIKNKKTEKIGTEGEEDEEEADKTVEEAV